MPILSRSPTLSVAALLVLSGIGGSTAPAAARSGLPALQAPQASAAGSRTAQHATSRHRQVHAAQRTPGAADAPFATMPHAPMTRAPGQTASEVFVDVPCDAFLPGKANPSEWMATSTFVRVTQDGFNYQIGYDPFAQTYAVQVSGLASFTGILVQETVGLVAARLPAGLQPGSVRRVELWFEVDEHNLFPFERVGITALEEGIPPSSDLNSVEAQLLYDDARGFTGSLYFLDHLAAGRHAIDLGPAAVENVESALQDGEGWFGVGFAADGWDLGGSAGETVYWRMTGGGSLDVPARPFFRIVYNAPPQSFALIAPQDGATLATAGPTLQWEAAVDPNGDTPITYTVRLGADPSLAAALRLDAGTALAVVPPITLAPGTYYWEVEASDPDGATVTSPRWRFDLLQPTDVPDAPARYQLTAAPNPFNPRTTLQFALPAAATVDLEVFDLRGRRVRTLHRRTPFAAGTHRVVFDGRDDHGNPVATGTYFYRLRTPERSITRKLSLVK